MQKVQKILIFLTAILSILFFTQTSLAFNITSIALYSDDNGATTNPTTTMTPTDEMTLAINITGASLKELSITIYDSSQTQESSCYNTDTIESANKCSWVEWKNNSGEEVFADIRPSQTSWSIDKPNSYITTSSLSKFVFTPSKSSRYTNTSSWLIYLRANNGTETITSSLALNNTYHLELAVSKSSVIFDPGKRVTDNHPLAKLESSGYDLTYIPVTVIANAPYSWKAKSTDFSGGSSIIVSNRTLGLSFSNTPASQIYLNTTYKDLETSHPPSTDSGDQKQLFLWLKYPDDPDTTYTGNLTLQAYMTENPVISTTEPTVSMSASTDNTKPSISIISPIPLTWTKKDHTVNYNLNVTDTLSGFMNSLSKKSCTVYFGSTKISEVYVEKNPTYKDSKCTGSFKVPESGNKNINLNFTVADMAGNLAYNDTVWLQIDQSSLYITDLALVSTAKPNDIDWHFLKADSFRIVAHIRNQAGDAMNATVTSYLNIPSASVTVNSTAISSSSPYTTESNGNIDIEYSFTGSTAGPATLYLRAEDQMNNTVDYNRTFYITNYINSIHILTNFTDKVYSEGDNISIEVDTNTNTDPVYMANITAEMRDDSNDIVSKTDIKAGSDGKSQFYFDVPKRPSEYYTVYVNGFSPLDITKTVSNTTTIDIEWFDVTVNIHSDAYIDTNRSASVKVSGRIDYSIDPYNNTLVKDAIVTCYIRGPNNYNDTDTATVNSTSGYFCDGLKNITKKGIYRFEISAEKTIDGFNIRGWNKEESMNVLNLSELVMESTSSIESSLNSGLKIISYPEKLFLDQNNSVLLNVTIKNTGKATEKNITFKLQSEEIDLMVLDGVLSELEQNDTHTIRIEIFSSDTHYGSYRATIYFESAAGTNISESFMIDILPGLKEKQRVNETYKELENKLLKLRKEMNSLLPSDDEKINSLDSNLKTLEKFLIDLRLAIEIDDYVSADYIISDINDMLLGQEKLMEDEIHNSQKNTRRNIIIAIIIMIIIMAAALFYYMWLPEKPTDYDFRKEDPKPDSKPKSIIRQRIDEFIEKLKLFLKESRAYNYHRKERWSAS